jgi:hypothetical protein
VTDEQRRYVAKADRRFAVVPGGTLAAPRRSLGLACPRFAPLLASAHPGTIPMVPAP